MISLASFSLIAVTSTNASAYIDPGTGGMIIGGGIWPYIAIILAAIAGFFARFFFKPIKKAFKKLFARKSKKKKKE